MIASAPASKKRQTQLTVFAITSLKDSLSSIVTPQSGENIGSADISDGAMAKTKISTLRVNIVSLWGERFILLGLYMRTVQSDAARMLNQHRRESARNHRAAWIQVRWHLCITNSWGSPKCDTVRDPGQYSTFTVSLLDENFILLGLCMRLLPRMWPLVVQGLAGWINIMMSWHATHQTAWIQAKPKNPVSPYQWWRPEFNRQLFVWRVSLVFHSA